MSARRAFKQTCLEFAVSQGFDPNLAAITSGGRPRPSFAGDYFLGIHGSNGPWTGKTCADFELVTLLTLTRQFAGPMDRWDDALDALSDGMDDVLERLASLLMSAQNEIRARCDQLCPGVLGTFLHAPRVMGIEEPQTVGPEWFSAEQVRVGPGESLVYGFKATVTFGGARFMHPVPTMEV